jgi:hypothetical protein
LDWLETAFRPVDAQVGRLWGVDALAMLTPGVSPMAFALNNPISFVDPTGLTSESTQSSTSTSPSFEEYENRFRELEKKISNPPKPREQNNSTSWGGGVVYKDKADASLTVKDLNDIFKKKYGSENSKFVQPFSVEVVRLIFDASKPPEVFYRILTSNSFDWNTDEYTAAIWDVMNADQRITGDIVDMGNDKHQMGFNKSKNSFIVHYELPLFADETGLAVSSRVSLGIVTIHELIYHKHQKFSLWNQKHSQGSNALYNHFKNIKSGAYNPIARKNLTKHDASAHFFIDFTFNSNRVDNVNRKRR